MWGQYCCRLCELRKAALKEALPQNRLKVLQPGVNRVPTNQSKKAAIRRV
jgi:hypothetical protein